MKNLNLINPERRLGGHDFCGVNHANQTEVQTDNLSVSGRSEVSMTLDEQPGNHPVITPLSPCNHPLLPKQKSGKSLIRIGKNVAESHVRKYAGASRVWKYAAMVVLMLCLGVGEMWADNGWYSEGTWQIWVWPGTGDDTWKGPYNKESDADWGVIETDSYYIKGVGVNTWGSGVTSTDFYFSLNGTTYGGRIGTGSSSGNYYWENKNQPNPNVDIIANAANNPGNNTITCYFKYNDGNQFERDITYTIPGFTTTSTSQTFDNTTVNSNSSKTISFGTHYGTALTTSNCSITGTNASEFSVTSIDESGVTVQFAPTTAGNKSATLTITDAHSKTCTINLSGKTQYTVNYNKGSNGTGDNTTANKVYGTNLILLGETFTRTGYTQTAWNTNADGISGTPYNLNGTYSTDAALILYPTWTVKNYTITYSPSTPSHCTYTATPANANYGSTVNLTITPDANYVVSSVTAVDASSNPVSVTGTSPNYSFTMPASNVTVTVVTALSAIAVNYGAGANGSLAAEQNSASIGVSGSTVNGGSTVNFTATPNTGYEVEGWYSSYSAGVFSDKIDAAGTSTTYNAVANSTLNVYVKFKLSTYTITYANMTGATNHASNPATYNYESSAITLQTPTKEGYTFGGWFTNADLLAEHAAGTPAIANHSTGDKTFYAKWTAYSYTVRFNANGGSGSMDDETGFVYGTNKALTANAFTRPGYTFNGWATSANGEKVYDDGESVSILPASNGATVDLYAVWTERPYKIVYFAKPADWSNVYAYVWKESGTANASWPGVQLDASVAGTGTEVINCATYYYYKYYTDGGSADAEGTVGNSAWNQVIFNNGDNPGVANNTKTGNLTLTNGNAYGVHTGMQNTSTSGYSTSAKWTLRGSFNDWNGETYPFSCADNSHTYSVTVTGLTASTSYDFKIWGPDGVAYKYTGGKDASYNDDYDITSLLDGRDLILNEYSSNNNTFTAATNSYTFTIDVTDPKHPVLTVISGEEANYSATLQAGAHGSVTNAGATILHRYATTTITATPEPGYRFLNWTSTGGGTVTFGDENSATTTVTATADGATITANFTNEGIIYLDKSAIKGVWSGTPYVYFYSNTDYWNNDAGTGSKTSSSEGVAGSCIDGGHAMTRIGDSQIWYYDYSTTPGASSTRNCVVFLDTREDGYNWFTSCTAIRRSDFYPKQNMFVVSADAGENKNTTAYYRNKGYWRKYNDTDPGYVVKIYNGYANGSLCTGTYHFSSAEPGASNCTVDVPLNSGTNYFKVVGCDTTTINTIAYAGSFYRDGSDGTMNTDNSTNWLLTDESGSNTGVLATATGDYTFTLTLGEGKMYISVDFPLAVGDFRMVYNGKMRSTDVSKKDHPSNFIRKLKVPTVASDTTKRDTISFYVDPANTPEIRFQWCSKIEGYTITWRDTLASAKPVLSSITKAGVYNFEVTQTTTKTGDHSISCALLGAYNGNYYIRTDKAAGGWKTYKEVKDNQLVYSNISRQYDFDYYYCNWFNANDNVKFTIANDYNECVTDTVENDTYVTQAGDNKGKLSYSANIRFMFNDSTNVISRAYINGSKENNRYLVLTGDTKVFDKNGNAIPASSPLNANELEFDDQNNWVYQVDLQAQSGAQVDVTATYNGNVQSFIDDQVLVTATSGEANEQYPLRVVYDFKTNHLVTAWLPPTTAINQHLSVAADMMLIRHGQNAAQELTFNGGSIKNIHTMIGAMEFRKDSIVGHVGSFTNETSENKTYRYMMYYISFPFDVAVQDIYGCGQFNREWYLQYYDGADRAAKGFFRGDGTTTFWKFMNLTDTLKAGTGYSLLLDNDYFNTAGENVWTNNPDKVYLYFPSATILHADSVISSTTKTLQIPAHECRHDRTFFTESGREVNHKFTDSHWNMMGVPLFQNYNASIASFAPGTPVDSTVALAEGKGYFYDWSPVNNTFTIHAADNYQFKSMHGYMVQFYGPVSFTGSAIHTKPSPVVARRTPLNREDYTLELQLLRNNTRTSRTYIELREEACDTFALNEDVYMMYTSLPADLFTFAGNYDVSANVLSVDNHVVPVGVEVHQAGEYTFAMPDNFSGSAVLVDTEANTRTNLAISDYTVTLPKGLCDGRFFIELDINKIPTSIDVIGTGGSLKDGKAHKFIENGAMYILRDGVIYDARGNKVK